MEKMLGNTAGEVVIGCNEYQSMNELAVLMTGFRQKYPAVRFQIKSGNNEEIKKMLEEDEIDVGLVLGQEEKGYSSIRMQCREEWGVLVHEDSYLTEHFCVHWKELSKISLITVADGDIRQELSGWSGEDAEEMSPCICYHSLLDVAQIVRSGEGVAVCQRPDCHFDNLRFLPFEPRLRMRAFLLWKKERNYADAGRTFIEFLKRCRTDI